MLQRRGEAHGHALEAIIRLPLVPSGRRMRCEKANTMLAEFDVQERWITDRAAMAASMGGDLEKLAVSRRRVGDVQGEKLLREWGFQ